MNYLKYMKHDPINVLDEFARGMGAVVGKDVLIPNLVLWKGFLNSGKELLVLGLSGSRSVGLSVSRSVGPSKKCQKNFTA